MWGYRLIAPRRFERVTLPQPEPAILQDGEVLLKLGAAGICGSDIPKFLARLPENPSFGEHGFPIHEIVGTVVASNSRALEAGQRVVGFADRSCGLREYFVNRADSLHVLRTQGLSDVHATVIQPVCTVLNALARLPRIEGKRAAVIGLGPLGMIFTHVLGTLGAASVTGVDVVDRSDVAARFRINRVVTGRSRDWAASLAENERPDIVIEAVGHNQGTLADAMTALAFGGEIVAFGIPDDDYYAVPFQRFFRKNAILYVGTTKDWCGFLARAEDYVAANRADFEAYVTDVFPVQETNEAFTLYSLPAVGRLKVVLSA